MNVEKTVKSLEDHGFEVRRFKTGAEAADYLVSEINGKDVGFGGSVTVRDLGVYERLAENNTLHWYWKSDVDKSKAGAIVRAATRSEVYLCSANAIAETGEIVNLDGTGNRVAAMLYDKEALYIVAGVNKIVPTLEDAIRRTREIAAPLNAKRIGTKTPCVVDGKCHDCKSPERICRGFSIHISPMNSIGKTVVVLIDESLGF